MIEIREIDASRSEDANLKNQPFAMWGRMIPALRDGKWSYRILRWEAEREMCFPDFPYDVRGEKGIFLGAYEDGACIGVAVLRPYLFRYLYLEDLKVDRSQRRQGVGGLLIDACMKRAKQDGLLGVYTVGQDDNLSACLFYLKHGFEIGGFDNRSYRGTSQEGKADIYFYRDCAAEEALENE